MKKRVLYLLLAVLGFVVLPSCGKNDETESIIPPPPPPPPPAASGAIWTALDGTYNGTLTYTVMGGPQEASSALTVEKTGGWKIQLSVNGLPMPGMSAITFPDITVTEHADKTCTFSGTIEDSLYSADITGLANEVGKITFSGSIIVPMMPAPITISYTGSK